VSVHMIVEVLVLIPSPPNGNFAARSSVQEGAAVFRRAFYSATP
jgi:hypothetical protein